MCFFLLLCSLPAAADVIEPCFVPGQDCTNVVVQELGKAKKFVRIQAYGFTSKPIEDALVSAEKRGVDVQIILDSTNATAKFSGLKVVRAAGIPTTIDRVHAIAHNKVMVIDGVVVLTGSFNFTTAAQKHNAENLVVLRDENAAVEYTANWQRHREHSK